MLQFIVSDNTVGIRRQDQPTHIKFTIPTDPTVWWSIAENRMPKWELTNGVVIERMADSNSYIMQGRTIIRLTSKEHVDVFKKIGTYLDEHHYVNTLTLKSVRCGDQLIVQILGKSTLQINWEFDIVHDRVYKGIDHHYCREVPLDSYYTLIVVDNWVLFRGMKGDSICAHYKLPRASCGRLLAAIGA